VKGGTSEVSRFERHPRLTLALALLGTLALVEAGLRLGYAAWADGFDADQAALLQRDGIDDVGRFWRELEHLGKDLVQYHPYRWYALAPSVAGRYHVTDRAGFRNGPLDPATAKIAFFGGSTTYSVRTTAADSIPGLVNRSLDRRRVEAVNFGLGGYSSTAELMTFIEVTRRRDHGIHWAVFLDGVNEASRFAEKWQDLVTAPQYDVMGYRWPGALYALDNEVGISPRPRSAIGRALGWVIERIRTGWRARHLAPTEEDYRRAGRAAAEIYFHNIEDIRALALSKHIEPFFVLQPTLFEIPRPTAREEGIRVRLSNRKIDIGKLYDATYTAIRADPRFHALGIHDLRHALDDVAGEIFFDDCHLTRAGNARLAELIRALLPPLARPGPIAGRGP
jgi:hypothetical protein